MTDTVPVINDTSWSEVLVLARAAVGMSQHDVAARMGTSQPAVARLESGKCNPSLATLRRYAAAIGAKLTIKFERLNSRV